MLWFLFLFGLALGAETRTNDPPVKMQRGNCPPFWFNFKGRCYKYVSTHLTWADAELHCVSQRANLVSIHSLGEQNFVKDLVRNFDPSQGRTWIGLNDRHKEGRWMWSDGCPAKFFYWAAREPNNLLGIEDCVHINYGRDKKWNDIRCFRSRTYPSVCASQIPCP